MLILMTNVKTLCINNNVLFVFISKYCLTVFVNERKLLSKLVHSVYACDKHLPVDVDMKSI